MPLSDRRSCLELVSGFSGDITGLTCNTVTIAVMKHGDQASLGEFVLHFHITVHHRRKLGQELQQGRKLEAEVNAKAMEGCCLKACSACSLIEPRPTSLG